VPTGSVIANALKKSPDKIVSGDLAVTERSQFIVKRRLCSTFNEFHMLGFVTITGGNHRGLGPEHLNVL
jgi:hypothetical protein